VAVAYPRSAVNTLPLPEGTGYDLEAYPVEGFQAALGDLPPGSST